MTTILHRSGESFILESNALRVVCDPQLGGKVRSFYSKLTGREYLYQDLRDQLAGTEYNEHDISGLDECFPSVMPCEYPDDPWQGTAMGDHGLLWNRRWEAEACGEQLITRTNLEFVPLQFTRTMELVEPHVMEFRYEIENRSDADFEFLYAAHFMLQADPTTRIAYPEEMDRAYLSVVIDNPVLKEHSWTSWPPDAESLVREPLLPENSTLAKLFSPRLTQGLARVSHGDLHEQLQIEFDTDRLPHLGVLLAPGFGPAGKDTSATAFALEPTSSIADDLQMARDTDTTQRIPAGRGIQFWVRLSIGEHDAASVESHPT